MKKKGNTIGEMIRERRIKFGWSQAKLAKLTGYSRHYILKLENSQIKNPGIKTLEKIINCLGIGLEGLLK